MKKRIGTMFLVFTLIFSFTACGNNENAMTDTDKAKASVEGFYKAFKELNVSEIKKYVPEDDLDEIDEDDLVEGEELERAKLMLSKTSVEYKSGEIEEDASSGTLTYIITALDFDEIFDQLISVEMTESGEPDMSSVDWDKVMTKDIEADIEVIKEGENWVIADPLTAMKYLVIEPDLEEKLDGSDTSVELEGIGTEWVVDDLFKVKIDSVVEIKERNEDLDINPSQVIIITYTYENLGLEDGLMIEPFRVVDEEGNEASKYVMELDSYPELISVGSEKIKAQQAYALNSDSSTIDLDFYVVTDPLEVHRATFNVSVSK